jgi:DNA-binding winged helix-turn-helix (wHTH) protein
LERPAKARFDEFEIDSQTRQLTRGDEAVHLSPKAFAVLCALVEKRPNVVPKADLFGQIWPDVFVVEGNLNVLVGEIRRALGDDPQEQRFIRTVHGVGYAFCATVTDDAGAGSAPLGSWLTCGERQIRLSDGENIIGREPEAAVWLDFSAVSRRHARIVLSGDRATVEDLGSKNGTQVRGERISGAVELEDGDEIRIGSVVLNFRMPGRPGSTVSLV